MKPDEIYKLISNRKHRKNTVFFVSRKILTNTYSTMYELQTLIDNVEQNEVDLQVFLKNVRKYTDPKGLTAELLNDLVEKIVIHAPDNSSGHRKKD